jgi:hypothetical protein
VWWLTVATCTAARQLAPPSIERNTVGGDAGQEPVGPRGAAVGGRGPADVRRTPAEDAAGLNFSGRPRFAVAGALTNPQCSASQFMHVTITIAPDFRSRSQEVLPTPYSAGPHQRYREQSRPSVNGGSPRLLEPI